MSYQNLPPTANRLRLAVISSQQTLHLRHEVLWPDLPLSSLELKEDSVGLHLGAFLGERADPVAVVSLFVEDIPPSSSMQRVETSVQQEVDAAPAKAVRFRKFACDIAFQGQGIGSTLLAYAQDIAREHFGASILWCDARVSAIAWYERRGYSTFGESFYKGPVEYCRMRIDI